jgi:Cu-Zn family superoxide dismutase
VGPGRPEGRDPFAIVARMANLRMIPLVLLCSTAFACPSDDDGTADTTTATTTATDGAVSSETGLPDTGTTAVDPTTDPTSSDGPGTSTSPDPDSSSGPGSEEDSTTAAVVSASATLEPKSGSNASGTAVFTVGGDGTVELVVDAAGIMPPGTHALHIHVNPDCSAEDGTSAGDHWNPPGTMLGELGTMEIAEDGTGTFTKSDAWSVGTGAENDVVNRSIIIHEAPDGGTRLACGVINLD